MILVKRSILTVCGLALATLSLAPQAAAVYKRELPDGSVTYSDQPDPGAKTFEPPPPQVIEPFTPSAASPDRGANSGRPAQQALVYEEVAIASPTPDEVVWNNENLLDVTVSLRPPLRPRAGHGLLILLDGKPVARSEGEIQFQLNDVFRGTHVLQAVITDRAGSELQRSEPVTFHVRQASLLSPARRP